MSKRSSESALYVGAWAALLFGVMAFSAYILLQLYPSIIPHLFQNTYGASTEGVAAQKVSTASTKDEVQNSRLSEQVSDVIRLQKIQEKVALRGQFGDSYAPLAAIFAAAALTAGFITVVIQLLALWRTQRSEARAQVFQLIQNYQMMLARISVPERKTRKPDRFRLLHTHQMRTGVDYKRLATENSEQAIVQIWIATDGLYHLWHRVYRTSDDRRTLTHDQLVERYESVYSLFEYQLDALMRTLYRVYAWIDALDTINEDEQWLLASLVRANLSNIELCWLFANALTERGAKAKTLCERYAVFDNLGRNHPALRRIGDKHLAQSAFSSDEARKQLSLPR